MIVTGCAVDRTFARRRYPTTLQVCNKDILLRARAYEEEHLVYATPFIRRASHYMLYDRMSPKPIVISKANVARYAVI